MLRSPRYCNLLSCSVSSVAPNRPPDVTASGADARPVTCAVEKSSSATSFDTSLTHPAATSNGRDASSVDSTTSTADAQLQRAMDMSRLLATRTCPPTGGALTANLRALQSHLSYPACIASGNFILAFPSIINSRSRLFSRWRMRAMPAGNTSRADDKFGCRACVNEMRAWQERSV